MSDINSRIRSLRKEKKLTQAAFCQLVGTSQGNLSDIENGKAKPPTDTIIAMAIAFEDLSLRWLLTGENIDKDQCTVLDEHVLTDVIEVVEWALVEVKATPEPRKKAELISAVYDFYLDEGVPKDREKLLKLVKAVA